MLNTCVKRVDRQFINLDKACGLSAIYTSYKKYLTGKVFFVHGLCSFTEQLLGTNQQPCKYIFNLLTANLYTLSTTPTNTNKLYKGFSL